MNYLIKPLSDSELYSIHNQITFYIIFIWILVCFIGYFINNKKYKICITFLLISISFLQEIFDYVNRFFINEIYASTASIQTDLPLQLCHFAYWFSVLSLVSQIYKNEYGQFYFNCAYFLGFSGALQGILTVYITGVYTAGDMIAPSHRRTFTMYATRVRVVYDKIQGKKNIIKYAQSIPKYDKTKTNRQFVS